ncbi:hypothetical protein GCM10009861_09270 [Neomicrococcus aestuarii]
MESREEFSAEEMGQAEREPGPEVASGVASKVASGGAPNVVSGKAASRALSSTATTEGDVADKDAMSAEIFEQLFDSLHQAEVARRQADAEIFRVTSEIVELSARDSSQLNERGTLNFERLAIPPRPGMITSVRAGVGPGQMAELAVTYHLAQELDISEYEAAALMRRAHSAVHVFPMLQQKISAGEVPRRAVEHAIDEIEKITPPPVDTPLPDEQGNYHPDELTRFENDVKAAQEQVEAMKNQLASFLESRLTGKTAWQVKKLAENWRKRHHLKSPAAAHKVARENRFISIQSGDDGMSYVNAYIPTVAAEALQRRLDKAVEQARLKDPKDPRSTDETRTDAFLNLILPSPAIRKEQEIQEAQGREPEWITDESWLESISATIAVLIPSSVLTGVQGAPATSNLLPESHENPAAALAPENRWAEGERFGTIDPDSARELARRATVWRRLIEDPLNGSVNGIDTYQPSREQRDALLWRDRFCRVPGCQRPGRSCDADHLHEAQDGGKTTLENLALLCRKHHRLKSLGHLRIRSGKNGELTITDRFGLSVKSRPWESLDDSPTRTFRRRSYRSLNDAA